MALLRAKYARVICSAASCSVGRPPSRQSTCPRTSRASRTCTPANNAPAIYKAAYLSRKTYSAIISDENHVVSKRTAIQLAFALRLSREEADLLLHAAGYHLSRSVVEDMIFDACLEANIHNLEDVNHFLLAYECRPFVPQD